MAGLVEKSMLAGLGMITLTRDKIVRVVDGLVKEGAVTAEESRGLVDKLVAKGEAEREKLRTRAREEVDKTRSGVTPASRQDIEELNCKIDELTARVDKLAKKPASGKKETS